MPAMQVAGHGHVLSERARVRVDPDEYVIELDVPDFEANELSVEMLGRVITVRANQHSLPGDSHTAFRLHERLEESFRLPDDADPERTSVLYVRHMLEVRAPRVHLEPRQLTIGRSHFDLFNPDAEVC